MIIYALIFFCFCTLLLITPPLFFKYITIISGVKVKRIPSENIPEYVKKESNKLISDFLKLGYSSPETMTMEGGVSVLKNPLVESPIYYYFIMQNIKNNLIGTISIELFGNSINRRFYEISAKTRRGKIIEISSSNVALPFQVKMRENYYLEAKDINDFHKNALKYLAELNNENNYIDISNLDHRREMENELNYDIKKMKELSYAKKYDKIYKLTLKGAFLMVYSSILPFINSNHRKEIQL